MFWYLVPIALGLALVTYAYRAELRDFPQQAPANTLHCHPCLERLHFSILFACSAVPAQTSHRLRACANGVGVSSIAKPEEAFQRS